jgi:hypothetical protein
MPAEPDLYKPPLTHIQACEQEAWHLEVWKHETPGDRRRIVFRCRSWRHEGPCREWKGAQDFARIQEAIAKRTDWTYCVFTFAQSEWPSKTRLYRAGLGMWASLRKRLIRKWGKLAYIQTWEQHANGFPHVNVLIGCDAFYAAACDDWRVLRNDWLKSALVQCGFGYICWVEPMKDGDAMAGYLVKLARELTGAGHKNQTPTESPRHFRRIRASRGLLPPPHKDPDITGVLHKCDASGYVKVLDIPMESAMLQIMDCASMELASHV